MYWTTARRDRPSVERTRPGTEQHPGDRDNGKVPKGDDGTGVKARLRASALACENPPTAFTIARLGTRARPGMTCLQGDRRPVGTSQG